MTYLLGLTGGIASGKSTVSAMFKEAGYPVVDADIIARQIVEPGQPALQEIKARFGAHVIQPDGSLDRHVLGRIVFADKQALADLNAIDRPYLRTAIHDALNAAAATGAAIVVGDIPLLYETGWQDAFDGVCVVDIEPALQLSRLMARDHLEEQEAKQRIAAQMPLADKVAQADFVINNSLGPVVRQQQVQALIARLRALDETP
ncbi:dephospho-CoA kinase [Lacticaseibacillus sp. GG6-2]